MRAPVLPVIEQRGLIWAFSIDDPGIPKTGNRLVGVAQQYGEQIGKQDNRQVALSLSNANVHASLPINGVISILKW